MTPRTPLEKAMKIIRSFLLLAAALISQSLATAQSARGVENEAALAPFFQALTQLQTGARRAPPVRIVQFGDSHTVADLLTGALRKSFQRDFGQVVYQVFGKNGMRARQLLAWMSSWTARDVADLAALAPDLIVIAYGTNEVTDADWSVDSYARLMAEIVNRLRRIAPRAAVLILAPPDREVNRGAGWQFAARMPQLLDAERRAALSVGAAFWNACDAMGGLGSMSLWVMGGLGQPDHVHLTRDGYTRLGQMLYYDFVLAFNQFVQMMNQKEALGR